MRQARRFTLLVCRVASITPVGVAAASAHAAVDSIDGVHLDQSVRFLVRFSADAPFMAGYEFQLFIAEDDDSRTGYGSAGFDLVVRGVDLLDAPPLPPGDHDRAQLLSLRATMCDEFGREVPCDAGSPASSGGWGAQLADVPFGRIDDRQIWFDVPVDGLDLGAGQFSYGFEVYSQGRWLAGSSVYNLRTGSDGCTADSDGDGIDDCLDDCPNDPNKTGPGVCGCGQRDADLNKNGIIDCTESSACRADSDDDGVPDCRDACAYDPEKTSPGACGCGATDCSASGGGPVLVENFDRYVAKSDPADWLDTDMFNSMQPADHLFETVAVDRQMVFATDSTLINIHSHYVGAGSRTWASYEYRGRMMVASGSAGIGVTFYSDYPRSDFYYRIRRLGGGPFHLSPHLAGGADGIQGVLNSGVTPVPGTWYWFRILVAAPDGRTGIYGKVWPANAPEPEAWQIEAYDGRSSRRSLGTVGVWSMGPGLKAWDDLEVVIFACNRDSGSGGCDPCDTTDCNHNGVTDGCEILDGSAIDADGNGIPDECDVAPSVFADGCRVLGVSAAPGSQPIALRLTAPQYPCFATYLGRGGTLSSEPEFRTPEAWGAVRVVDGRVVPGITYGVAAVYVDFTTTIDTRVGMPPWGDVVGRGTGDPPNGIVDFVDIGTVVECYKEGTTAPPVHRCDLLPVAPDGRTDFLDLGAVVAGFKGHTAPFPGPDRCP